MEDYLTPSALRALEAAALWAARSAAPQIEPIHVVLGIAQQDESRGATILETRGLSRDTLERHSVSLAVPQAREPVEPAGPGFQSEAVRTALGAVRVRARERGPSRPAG